MLVTIELDLPIENVDIKGYQKRVDELIEKHFVTRVQDPTQLPTTYFTQHMNRFKLQRVSRSFVIFPQEETFTKDELIGLVDLLDDRCAVLYKFTVSEDGRKVLCHIEMNGTKSAIMKYQPFNKWLKVNNKPLLLDFDTYKKWVLDLEGINNAVITDHNYKHENSQQWHEDYPTYLKRTGRVHSWARNEILGYRISQLEDVLIGQDLADGEESQMTFLNEFIMEKVSATTVDNLKTALSQFLNEIHQVQGEKNE